MRLRLKPEERFADMDEFRRALQGEVVAPIPVVAPPVPAPTPVPLPKPSPLPPPGPLSFFEKMAIKLGLPAWLLGAAAGVLALVAIVAVIPKPKPSVEEPHREKSKGEDQTKGGEQNKTPVIVEKPNDGPVDGGPHKGGKDEGKEKKPDDSKVPPFDGSIKPGPEKKIPARITAFEFKPDRIERGQSTELRWSVEGATNVTLDGVAVELSGRRTLKPNDDLRARLTAETPTGTLERTAVVSVVEPPPPPIPKPIQTGSWSVYHHHGIGVASFMIDWGQLRNPRAVVRGEKDPCFGTLSLSGTRLRFDSLSSNDSFTTELSNIDKVEINRNRIAGETAFQVKIHKGKNYNFVPRQSVQSVVGSIRSAMSR